MKRSLSLRLLRVLLPAFLGIPPFGCGGDGSGGAAGGSGSGLSLFVKNTNPFSSSSSSKPSFKTLSLSSSEEVRLTIDHLDVSEDAVTWVRAADSGTIDLFASSTLSGGYRVEMRKLPAGTYRYARLYITRLSYIDGGGTTNLTNQLRGLLNSRLNPLYFSYNGSVPGITNGVTDLFYERSYDVGTLMPFTATGDSELTLYFVVPEDFIADDQLTCKPKLTFMPKDPSDVSLADIGTVSGSIAGISAPGSSVFVGAYRDFQIDVAPNFFAEATNNGNGTATYSLDVPPGSYQIVAIEDVDGNMSATVFPTASDRVCANGAVPAGITPAVVAAGANVIDNLAFFGTVSNIPEYGGRIGDSAARLTVNGYRVQGMAIDTNVARLFLEVYPQVGGLPGSAPLRVDIGDVGVLVNAIATQTHYTYTFVNLPTGDYYFKAHLDMNGNGVKDPGDFSAEPITYSFLTGSSLTPFTVTPGGTIAAPVNLNSADPIYLQWAARDIPFGDSSTSAVDGYAYAVGDFDGDGILDLATTADHTTPVHADPDKLGIHLGNGDGTFQERADYDTGIGVIHIATGDLDGDGKLDIVTFSEESSSDAEVLNVHLNDGTGGFPTFSTIAIASGIVEGDLLGLLALDVNGDGDLDLISAQDEGVGGGNPSKISFFEGNGDGTFQAAVHFDGPPSLWAIKAGDINNDGRLDVIVGSNTRYANGLPRLAVLLNNGAGPFAAAVQYVHPYGGVNALALADLDEDGFLDVISSPRVSGGGTILIVHLGNGDGTFKPPSEHDGTVYGSDSIAVADFDGDSHQDLVVGSRSGSGIFAHRGLGDGSIPEGTQYTPHVRCLNPQVHDLNSDGKPDLTWVVNGVGSEAGFSEARVYIVLGQ